MPVVGLNTRRCMLVDDLKLGLPRVEKSATALRRAFLNHVLCDSLLRSTTYPHHGHDWLDAVFSNSSSRSDTVPVSQSSVEARLYTSEAWTSKINT